VHDVQRFVAEQIAAIAARDDALATVRHGLLEAGHPVACIEFVCERFAAVLDECGAGVLRVAASTPREADVAQRVARHYRAVTAGLGTALAASYAELWFAAQGKGGETNENAANV
jgi:hypothetical protein